MPSTERRLAAIMFTDIVGSTAVTARSESAGLALRDRHRELVRTQVERYHGRFIEAPATSPAMMISASCVCRPTTSGWLLLGVEAWKTFS